LDGRYFTGQEGDELSTDKQAIRFFYTAKGSSAEILTQAIIAFEIGYVDKDNFDHIERECQSISGMLTRLIQSRSK
jgi:four helix bundle protein